jgi:hypothetical protein
MHPVLIQLRSRDRGQNQDDGYDDQELDQREATAAVAAHFSHTYHNDVF